jgi:hypothetical protein
VKHRTASTPKKFRRSQGESDFPEDRRLPPFHSQKCGGGRRIIKKKLGSGN